MVVKNESEEHVTDMRKMLGVDRVDERTVEGSPNSSSANEMNAEDEGTIHEIHEGGKNPDIDGGWAWMVAIGMVIFYFTIGGFFKSFGVLYAAILDQYDRSAWETSLIAGVRAASMIFLGPLSTTLSQRTSERAMIITGAVVITSGFMVSYFATSMEFLIGSIGLVPGIGVGLIVGPSNIMIGKYFDKRRATAMSVTSSAGCVGQITVPLLMVYLIENYSVRGALLIYGGVIMHTVATGMIMRPLSAKEISMERQAESHYTLNPKNKATNDIPEQIGRGEQVIEREACQPRDANNSLPLDRDVQYTKDDPMELEPLHTGGIGSSEDGNRSRIHICYNYLKTFLHDLFYYELLLQPSYVIVLIACVFSLTMLVCQQVYLFTMAESVGFTREQSAMFLSIFGGADMAGRLATGLLSDGKWMKPLHVMAMGCFLSGTAFCFVPLATSLYSMIPLVIVIGGFISVNTILVMPVLVASLGMQMFPKAFSMILFFQGIAAAVSPPLLGLIKDWLGIYGPVFPLTGGLQILGAVLLLLEPLARKRCQRKEKVTQHSDITEV